MGNKGSKGSKSLRPPIKSDSRGFKFGNYANGGRDAGKSAPAAPSCPSTGPSSVAGQTQGQQQQQNEDECTCSYCGGSYYWLYVNDMVAAA